MRDIFTVINSFIHDMATGVWIAVLLMMYIIFGHAESVMVSPEVDSFIGILMERLWLAAVASMIVVVITGFIRGFTFKRYGWTGDVGRDRKRLLFIKHAILGSVFAVGLYLQFMMMSKL